LDTPDQEPQALVLDESATNADPKASTPDLPLLPRKLDQTRVTGEPCADHLDCILSMGHYGSQRRVEHGHYPNVRKVFFAPPPENEGGR